MARAPRDHRDAPSRAGLGASNPLRQGAAAIGAALPPITSRAQVLLVAFAALVAIFFFRLVFLQVIVADQYAAQAEESRTVSFDTTPRRGTIYDRNGIVLATSVDATTIYANPVEVTDAAAEAQALAGILGGEAADYQELLSTPSTTFVYIKRQADVEAADKVKELKLDGIYFIADTRREYPHGSVGAQVIGFCNADGEGITGLELQYNDILCGTPGRYVGERGEQGFPIPGGVKEEVAAIDGTDIMISLDIKLQDTVEQALADGVEEVETDEGSALVMDAATGEVREYEKEGHGTGGAGGTGDIGAEGAKAAALAHAGLTQAAASDYRCWMDYDDGYPHCYRVEFTTGPSLYQYQIGLYDGAVLHHGCSSYGGHHQSSRHGGCHY